jgi:lysophospholipase L1-like esterase
MRSGRELRARSSARVAGICLGLTLLLGLLAVAPASAAPSLQAPAAVQIGKVRLATPSPRRAALLVPVRYPIQLAGHRVSLDVSLGAPGHVPVRHWKLSTELSAAGPRPVEQADRRRAFTFVHRVALTPGLARQARRMPAQVRVSGLLDANRDGIPELSSTDGATQRPAGAGAVCGSVPRLRTRPGKAVSVRLPVCGKAMRWRIFKRPEHGTASIRRSRLVYRPAAKFRGSEELRLIGAPRSGSAGASGKGSLVDAPLEVTVGTAAGVSVRAIGDSVTAGFGYYDNGSLMPFTSLYECRPGVKPYNDACSSNSVNTSASSGKLKYAPDYGLANKVSWAAQWASEHGVTNFENLAVSGSEPSDWAPGGDLHEIAARMEAENPDYILMTMGANPLLSEMLFGVDNMGCAIYSSIFGGYAECVEEAFAEVHLQRELKSLYTDLVQHTEATIFLMQYHLSVPSVALAYSAAQIAEMGALLNREIAKVAAEVSKTRLQVIAPPHFNVGIDVEPVYPSTYSCSYLGYKVDGPSVQSTPTQDELEVLHPLSFCEGPKPEGPPWVISGDTGIHPSAAGYAQMASRLPAPSGS